MVLLSLPNNFEAGIFPSLNNQNNRLLKMTDKNYLHDKILIVEQHNISTSGKYNINMDKLGLKAKLPFFLIIK